MSEDLVHADSVADAQSEKSGEQAWRFKIVQNGQVVASGYGTDGDAVLAEASHYAMMYGQDGECQAHVWKGDRSVFSKSEDSA